MPFPRRSSMTHLYLSAALLALGLSGCHRSADSPPPLGSVAAAQAAAQQAAASQSGTAPGRAAEGAPAPAVPAASTSPQRAALQQAAPGSAGTPTAVTPNVPVQLPASVFTPTPNDVLSAFAQSLAGTVLRMPASPQRDDWYREQVLTLKTLKVGGCTQSTAGTKSTCRVALAGQEFDAHLLLTKEGWALVE